MCRRVDRSEYSGGKWIKYEIEAAWNAGKGVVGVYVHNLKDASEDQTTKGRNPLEDFNLDNGTALSSVAKAYDPPYTTSTYVYDHIRATSPIGWKKLSRSETSARRVMGARLAARDASHPQARRSGNI